jgi:hypothetical protein
MSGITIRYAHRQKIGKPNNHQVRMVIWLSNLLTMSVPDGYLAFQSFDDERT